MWCELKKIQKRLGKDKFPLINQTFYTSKIFIEIKCKNLISSFLIDYGSMIIAPDFPCVAKVSDFKQFFSLIII